MLIPFNKRIVEADYERALKTNHIILNMIKLLEKKISLYEKVLKPIKSIDENIIKLENEYNNKIKGEYNEKIQKKSSIR